MLDVGLLEKVLADALTGVLVGLVSAVLVGGICPGTVTTPAIPA